MPAVIYNLVTFAPSSAADFAEAQRIVAQVRIPHHAVIARWFDGIALAQVLWIAAALFLLRGNRLFLILAIPFGCSLLLTLVQLATGNDTLALLFPWRTSALLVPIATSVILARIILRFGPWLQRLAPAQATACAGTCGLILGACVAGGLAVPLFELVSEPTLMKFPCSSLSNVPSAGRRLLGAGGRAQVGRRFPRRLLHELHARAAQRRQSHRHRSPGVPPRDGGAALCGFQIHPVPRTRKFWSGIGRVLWCRDVYASRSRGQGARRTGESRRNARGGADSPHCAFRRIGDAPLCRQGIYRSSRLRKNERPFNNLLFPRPG